MFSPSSHIAQLTKEIIYFLLTSGKNVKAEKKRLPSLIVTADFINEHNIFCLTLEKYFLLGVFSPVRIFRAGKVMQKIIVELGDGSHSVLFLCLISPRHQEKKIGALANQRSCEMKTREICVIEI